MKNPATKPVAIECRFATYSKSNQDQSDFHLIKEQVHNPDGSITPALRKLVNYKRPFWVAKKGARQYEDRKEWEHLKNLNKFECTQTELTTSIAASLGQRGFRGNLRDLPESRFVYGSDITSTAIIKQAYRDKWDVVTPYTYSVFDTETDMLHGTDEIMMASITFKDKVYTVVQKKFVEGYANPVQRILELGRFYLGEIFDARKIVPEVIIVDTEIEIVKLILAKAHEWRPDFLAVWNLEFDMTKIIEACARAGVDPESLLCDPCVPRQYRSFRFKRGPAKKVTASGKVMSYTPPQRWHTIFCPSSFYWIDSMCVYKQVRTGQPEEPSYSLDSILHKDLKMTKLKFKEADHIASNSADWHRFMQKNYPLEYVVYNQFDCISMEILEELNTDVQLSLPMFAGCSDFQHFNSQPRRSVNELHYFVMKHDHIIGSTASEMADDNDTETLGIDKWINSSFRQVAKLTKKLSPTAAKSAAESYLTAGNPC